MITLTILLALIIIGALIICAVSAGFIIAFSDILFAALILYLIYKLVKSGKSKKN